MRPRTSRVWTDKTRRWRAILLPGGGVLPAEATYKNLLAELGADADARIKDLEVYATDNPPPDLSLDTEVGGIARVADTAGFAGFTSSGIRAAARCLWRSPLIIRIVSSVSPSWSRLGPAMNS